MKKNFINENFLLETKEAQTLYHEYAEKMPIIDYHCHLSPEEIAQDRHWENITQIWLYGDHYKWRAMRSNGIGEKYCTGDASDREKFDKWAATLPFLLRNPLYHWTHLELKEYFNIDDRLLGPDTAQSIWDDCSKIITSDDFSARTLILKSNVKLICTTDDPTDSLEQHRAIREDTSFKVEVLPTWRPDKGMAVENTVLFNNWIKKLEETCNIEIKNHSLYMDALHQRHSFFHENGCRLSDHGIDTFYSEDYTPNDIEKIFDKIRNNNDLDQQEIKTFKCCMLHEFGKMDHEKGWTQQYHYGIIRNNNTRLFNKAGPDAGFDSIGDPDAAQQLANHLDRLDRENKLAKTILYNANPKDNSMIAAMLGNFQDGSIPGKMQMGSAWWFLDQKNGMEQQIEVLSQLGLLSRFIGMLTDSRSFLSYTRHDYFRRILCNILGNDMNKGLIPEDYELTGKMVQDICYNNAREYLFPLIGIYSSG